MIAPSQRDLNSHDYVSRRTLILLPGDGLLPPLPCGLEINNHRRSKIELFMISHKVIGTDKSMALAKKIWTRVQIPPAPPSMRMKEKVRTIVFRDRKRWRRWLRVNHDRKNEIWLVLPKKSAGGDSYRVYYNQALEEALCFGWIDSRIKSLDATRSVVRFTPRKSKNWSQYNIDRALELVRKKKMTKAGLSVLPLELNPSRALRSKV
jgi:hypothetical protein